MSTSPAWDSQTFETLTLHLDGAVLFPKIAAPPMVAERSATEDVDAP